MRHPPQSAKATHVVEWNGGTRHRVLDEVATEEPLEIRVNHQSLSVTMRTPGDDFDLAAGFLFTEGIVTSREQIARIAYGHGDDGQPSGNLVDVTLADGATVNAARLERHFFTNSSCGVCGKTSIEAIRARDIRPLTDAGWIDPNVLVRLPGALRSAQRVFGRTGGLHAAALLDRNGAPLEVREDIGRHNAVDKIIGRALLDGRVPLSDRVLMVSGRCGFEIVQKALVGGVPIVASVSAPSSLAVQLAREMGLTLIGFVREQRFVVYSGEARVGWDTWIDASDSERRRSGAGRR
jgi:FdhD protein